MKKSPEDIEKQIRTLISLPESEKYDLKKYPSQAPFYLFVKLCKKYKKVSKIKLSPDKCRIMFPLFNRVSDKKILGWLCYTKLKKGFRKLEYFTGFMPYQNIKKDDRPFDRPALVITGGYTLCEKPSNKKDGFPNIRLELINSKHALAFGSNLIELNSINKLISEIIEINKEFEND